ncbi:hypothetical protein [Actinomadura sp. 6N118]|uniref:hypothetical protein n=1 Tax=Actinomadura sp. 6N118 TaxID=3375151 RepID=UPI0037A9F4E1
MTIALEISRLLAQVHDDLTLRRRLRLRVGDDPTESAAEVLHPVVTAPDLPRGEYLDPDPPPTTVEWLGRALQPLLIGNDRIAEVITAVCCTDLAYAAPLDDWAARDAKPIWRAVVDLLGDDARWWSNANLAGSDLSHGVFTDGVSWTAVTTFTFDVALVGKATDATVAVLAFADD